MPGGDGSGPMGHGPGTGWGRGGCRGVGWGGAGMGFRRGFGGSGGRGRGGGLGRGGWRRAAADPAGELSQRRFLESREAALDGELRELRRRLEELREEPPAEEV